MKGKILKIISLALTLSGIIWFATGDYTNGLLVLILGELVDMPQRF